MRHSSNVIFALLLLPLACVSGGKILVFPLDGSHWVNMKVLIEELHSKSHDITVVRASNSWYIKETSPFYTSVTVPNTGGFDEEFFGSLIMRQLHAQRKGMSIWEHIQMERQSHVHFSLLHKSVAEMTVQIFEDEKLMQSFHDADYDLVLTDPGIGVGTIVARRLKVPLVYNVRWTVQGEAHFVIAPSPLSYIPFTATEFTDKMSFPQRISNFISYVLGMYTMSQITEVHYRPVVEHYFGPDVNYDAFFQDADIYLMRNDFVFEFPRPTMPNIVYISGFGCKPGNPLPKDLEEFVQSSGEHGVVIMSLGTLVGELPVDITEDIAAAFAQLPQKVIWRHTGQRPATLGNNTLLVNWLPQKDLLAHPKTRVFVAHGGTNGVQEAIYHGVPILGLPLVFDQRDNLSRIKAKGAATMVDIGTMDKDTFADALKEVLHNPTYMETMQKLSRLHRDQPMKPLDRAVFWIEYVIRHKGAPHLRTHSNTLSWFAYHSVDVIATLLTVVLVVTFTCVSMLRCLWGRLFVKKHVKNE